VTNASRGSGRRAAALRSATQCQLPPPDSGRAGASVTPFRVSLALYLDLSGLGKVSYAPPGSQSVTVSAAPSEQAVEVF